MFLLKCLIYYTLLIIPILADLISPYLRKPIEPSINNEFETADYVFTFTTSIDLFSGDLLLIKFPSQYSGVPVVETIFLITLLKWNTDLKIWQNIQGATCVCTLIIIVIHPIHRLQSDFTRPQSRQLQTHSTWHCESLSWRNRKFCAGNKEEWSIFNRHQLSGLQFCIRIGRYCSKSSGFDSHYNYINIVRCK